MTLKCVALPALTPIAADVPVIEEVTVSVALIVRLPAVLSVLLNVPTPLVRAVLAGSVAAVSVLEKCTVPL